MKKYISVSHAVFEDGKKKTWHDGFLEDCCEDANMFATRLLDLRKEKYKLKGRPFVSYSLRVYECKLVGGETL